MEGPRPPQDKEFARVVDFLNLQLRPQGQWSIAQEYPTALTPTNVHNMRIITEEDRILSHAVLKPLIVKTPHMVLKVGAIGSVVTDESHRGQGLSTQVLMSCLDEARRQECDIALLWTDLHDFYRRLGFELAGFEQSFVIEKKLSLEPPKLQFKKTLQVDPEALLRLAQKQSVMTHRTPDEIRRFLQIPNSQLYTAWNDQGRLEAFAVEGKGADLGHYVHEWSGSVSALVALFNFIFESKGRAYTLIAPRHSQNLIQALESQGIFRHEGFLGMIKILDRQKLLAKTQRVLGPYGGLTAEMQACTDIQLTRLLFGPHDPELQNLIEAEPHLREVLPLRFWMWGWDSI